MKTAVSVLQEIMVLQGQCPKYECIAQTGLQHLATFEYQCTAYGISVTAIARSKKEAKQEAARIMLLTLDERGYTVPSPFCRGGAPVNTLGRLASDSCPKTPSPTVNPLSVQSYVALLKDLCDEYRLPGIEYELTAVTGPPHVRHFTVRASLGKHQCEATATAKKLARQLAAEQLYTYLKEDLSRVTKNFVEVVTELAQDEALERAYEKAMERCVERRKEDTLRSHLGLKVADYHFSLLANIDKTKRKLAVEALVACKGLPAKEALQAVVGALGLRVERHTLATRCGTGLIVLTLASDLAVAGYSYEEAAADALWLLRYTLAA